MMMIFKTRFTKKHFLQIHNNAVSHTKHLDWRVHGGSAVIIRKNFKHYETTSFQEDYLQATNIVIGDWSGLITSRAHQGAP